MKARRKVRVVERGDSIFVEYVERRPRGRYNAAQFSRWRGSNVANVKAWVATQSDLELVEEARP